jgi:hypothetical protein
MCKSHGVVGIVKRRATASRLLLVDSMHYGSFPKWSVKLPVLYSFEVSCIESGDARMVEVPFSGPLQSLENLCHSLSLVRLQGYASILLYERTTHNARLRISATRWIVRTGGCFRLPGIGRVHVFAMF